MSTKFRNSEEVKKAFQDLFAFKSTEEEIEHKALIIMYRFLSEVEILTEERKITRKELALKIGTSASYLTQLYRGNKLLNLTTIAKFEKALGISFNIKASADVESEGQSGFLDHLQFSPFPIPEPEGFWYYKKFNKQPQESGVPRFEEGLECVSSNKSAA